MKSFFLLQVILFTINPVYSIAEANHGRKKCSCNYSVSKDDKYIATKVSKTCQATATAPSTRSACRGAMGNAKAKCAGHSNCISDGVSKLRRWGSGNNWKTKCQATTTCFKNKLKRISKDELRNIKCEKIEACLDNYILVSDIICEEQFTNLFNKKCVDF